LGISNDDSIRRLLSLEFQMLIPFLGAGKIIRQMPHQCATGQIDQNEGRP
jgi:hypothetical protein